MELENHIIEKDLFARGSEEGKSYNLIIRSAVSTEIGSTVSSLEVEQCITYIRLCVLVEDHT